MSKTKKVDKEEVKKALKLGIEKQFEIANRLGCNKSYITQIKNEMLKETQNGNITIPEIKQSEVKIPKIEVPISETPRPKTPVSVEPFKQAPIYLVTMSADLLEAIDRWLSTYEKYNNNKTIKTRKRMLFHKQFLENLQSEYFLNQIGRTNGNGKKLPDGVDLFDGGVD